MEPSLIQYTEHYLKNSKQRNPIPTALAPGTTSIHGIKVVLFDIYGTLVISSSGDVDIKTIAHENVLKALEKTGIVITASDHMYAATQLRTLLVETITRIHEEQKAKGIPFPEVNIIGVWEQVFTSASCKKIMTIPGTFDFRDFAFIFELYNNPVSPMPAMKQVLTTLADHGFILGIISNAQFYTPILLHYFMTGSIVDTEYIHLFSR